MTQHKALQFVKGLEANIFIVKLGVKGPTSSEVKACTKFYSARLHKTKQDGEITGR